MCLGQIKKTLLTSFLHISWVDEIHHDLYLILIYPILSLNTYIYLRASVCVRYAVCAVCAV